jgi:type VI secretion system protein ImpF
MTIRGPERTVRQSVLDRLIDRDPRSPAEPQPSTLSESVRQMKLALLRDIEWLLNTRRIPDPAPDPYPELDTTSLSGDDPNVRRRLQREIEECIRLFEPRLTSVSVSPTASADATRRDVRFTIEAVLRMEPNPERIVFDTVLDVSHGGFSVAGGTNA